MEFEWDEAKAFANAEKHGVAFQDAVESLTGWTVRKRDLRSEYGEDRWVALTSHEGATLVVAYTMRGGRLRIISARQANRKERLTYDVATKDRLQ